MVRSGQQRCCCAGRGPAAAQDTPTPAIRIRRSDGHERGRFSVGLFLPRDSPGVRSQLTTFASGDVGISLFSGDGGLKSAGINIGVWNSLHTGTSGSGTADNRSHYEEDFYVSLALGFGGGITVTPTFTAYTSPNGLFGTVQELSFKVGHASKFAPYMLVAVS